MNRFVVVSIEDRLRTWREAENAAIEAEQAVRKLGQAGASPEVRELLHAAKHLREQADRQFAAILRAAKAT